MARIFLVRHGQDEDNAQNILNGRRDTRLTELGKQQARHVAQKLKGGGTRVIYTSPLLRAYESAQIIAQELQIAEVFTHCLLIERDFGVLTGKPLTDIARYAKNILVTDRVSYFLEVEGAEDFPMVYRRGVQVLTELQNRHRDDDVLLVTHGDIGKMIRAAYYQWTWEQGLRTPYFGNTDVLVLPEEVTAPNV